MRLRVVVDCYSGLPNPEFELDEDEAAPLLARLHSASPIRAAQALPSRYRLGYRGLELHPVDLSPGRTAAARWRVYLGQAIGPDGIPRQFGTGLEESLLAEGGPLGETALDVQRMFARASRDVRDEHSAAPRFSAQTGFSGAGSAPIFEPGWWNDGGVKQLLNNCYNYSTDHRTDSFAQPGRASGRAISQLACADIKPLALLDGLEDAPWSNNVFPPSGHLVALVIAPAYDFHWYRKGVGGLWSHKVGPGPATALDNAGQLIWDPRVAERGPYRDFCGFLTVHHGHIKLV